MKYLNNVRLSIMGFNHDEAYLNRLRQLIRELRLKDRVELLVNAERNAVLDKLLQAKALGIPVIATKVGTVSEMLINGETGFLVKPGDELELAKAIEVLVKNHKLRERFSAKAKIFSMSFTVERQVDKLEALYYDVFNRK
jgi:glycosyltransferase involved in cell wall biosynthesis